MLDAWCLEEVIGSSSANTTADRQRCHSDLEPSTSIGSSGPSTPRSGRFHAPFSKYSPDVARRSFGRLGRTLRSVCFLNTGFWPNQFLVLFFSLLNCL
jgi:hypothetical protein